MLYLNGEENKGVITDYNVIFKAAIALCIVIQLGKRLRRFSTYIHTYVNFDICLALKSFNLEGDDDDECKFDKEASRWQRAVLNV